MKIPMPACLRSLKICFALAGLLLATEVTAQTFTADFSSTSLDPNFAVNQWDADHVNYLNVTQPYWSVTSGSGLMSISLAANSNDYVADGPHVHTNPFNLSFTGDFVATITLDATANAGGSVGFFIEPLFGSYAGMSLGFGNVNFSTSFAYNISVPTGMTTGTFQLIRRGNTLAGQYKEPGAAGYRLLANYSDPSLTGAVTFDLTNYASPGHPGGLTGAFSNFSVVALPPLPPPASTAAFYGVGDLPGGIVFSEVRDAVIHNGIIYAVGGVTTRPGSPLQDTAFLWTSTGGMVVLPDVVANPTATNAVMASAISPDGTVIASRARNGATGTDRVAVRVTNSGTTNQVLGFIPGDTTYTAATSVSADGSILYGFGRYPGGAMEAFRWSPTDGLQALGFLNPGDGYSIPAARGISADGSVMVGFSSGDAGDHAFRYVHGSGMSALPLLDGGTRNEALAVSPDGNLVMGTGDSAAWPGGEVVLWDVAHSTMTPLGAPSEGLFPDAVFGGVTADGAVAVVNCADEFTDTAYLRNSHGWFTVHEVIAGSGVDLTGWTLSAVLGITSDGTLVFGSGDHNGNNEGWVARVPAGYLASYQPPATAPTITDQPQSTQVLVGNAVTLHVGADGTAPLDYQWSKDGVVLSGAVGADYTVGSATAADAGSYTVTAHNSAGSVTSAPAVITVNAPPAITTPPVGFTASVHGSGTLTVAASGLPAPTYQWRKDGAVLTGATSASLGFADLQVTDTGSYDVVITNAVGSVTSGAVAVVVAKLSQTISFTAPENQVYGGGPVTLSASATSGLPVSFSVVSGPATVSGNLATLTGPGIVTIAAAQAGDATYTAAPAVNQSFTVTAPPPPAVPVALVNHAPVFNGAVEGSVQQLLGEGTTFNGGASLTGSLFVPGTPVVKLNGSPTYGGTTDGSGGTAPSGYTITLNGGASVGHVVRRTNPVSLPVVAAPASPAGTRDVVLNNASQSVGAWNSVRSLTLNGNIGSVAVPAGAYGNFTANGGSGFVLGVAGATQPSVYSFQQLTLNGNSSFQIVGPVIVVVGNAINANSSVGNVAHPEWLVLKIASGGLVLNGNVSFYGGVTAPAGTVTVNGGSLLAGGLAADRLTINGGGRLRVLY